MTSNSLKRKTETLAFEHQVIKHPMFKRAYQVIEQIHASYQPLASQPGLVTHLVGGAEPEGAVILGDTGSGKTTLLRYYLRKNSLESDDESERVRVLYVPVPPKATTKKVVSTMLHLLNSPRWDKGTEQVQLIQLRQLLWEQGTELIIFDEINHLLRRHAGRSTVDVCDFFKSLMNDTKIPLILAGTLDSEEVILSNNELADRLNAVEYLLYFPLAKDTDSKDYFKGYMSAVESAIPVESISLTEPEMLKRFHVASSGIPRRIGRIVSETLQYADLSRPLTLIDFDKGYKKALRMRAIRPSPFDPSYTGKDLVVLHAKKASK